MPLGYLIDVRKSFYLVYLLVLVRPLYFADYITEVTGRGISPGEPVLLNSYFIVGVPPRVTRALAEGPFSRALICKSNGFGKLVCKEV
jgi:hypothetical protein